MTRSIEARPLAFARILVGIASLALAVEWLGPLLRVSSGDYLAMPVLPGWSSLQGIPVLILFGLSVGASCSMVLGLAGQLPAILLAGVTFVVLLTDQQVYSNHLLLLGILATLIGSSGAANALTVFGMRRSESVPYWPAFLIKAQITTLYAWTAIAKINPQYLSGEVIDTNLRPWVPIPDELMSTVAVLSILMESFLAVALWIPRFRILAFAVGGGLHSGILICLMQPAPLIPFAMLMATGYILFLHDSLERGQWKLPNFRVSPLTPPRPSQVGRHRVCPPRGMTPTDHAL